MVHFSGLYQAATSHPYFPIPYLSPLSAQAAGFSSSCEISRLPFLHWGDARIRMQDLSSAWKKGKRKKTKKKQDSLSHSWKCHPGPAINHRGLWCVYLLQWGASLSSTLLFTPLALCTPPANTLPFLLLYLTFPFFPLSHSLQTIHVFQSLHTHNPKHSFEITLVIFCPQTLWHTKRWIWKPLPTEPWWKFAAIKNGAVTV